MTITNILIQHGQVMMRKADLAKYIGVSSGTIDARCKDMEQEIKAGRYSEKVLTSVGGIRLINYLAFTDYLHYKERLDNKNARKHVPPYDPIAWARELAIYPEYQDLSTLD